MKRLLTGLQPTGVITLGNYIGSIKQMVKEQGKYEEENVKVEDVVNLTENFSGKNAILATTVIISVMVAMPPREFLALMETAKSITKAKLLEALKGILKENMEDIENANNNTAH